MSMNMSRIFLGVGVREMELLKQGSSSKQLEKLIPENL